MSIITGLQTYDFNDEEDEFDIENKRVLVRVDLDAPTNKSGQIMDRSAIKLAAQTIRPLLKRGAKIIVATRIGELQKGPGVPDKKGKPPSVIEAAAILGEELEVEVIVPDSCAGEAVKKVIAGLREKQICVIENLAREGDVGQRKEAFARELLPFADIFIADSLKALAIESATTTEIPRLLELAYLSPRLLQELRSIAKVDNVLDPPFLLVLGGAHLDRDLPLLHRLARKASAIFVGGVAAHTLLKSQGNEMGQSALEADFIAGGRTLTDLWGSKLHLPQDLVVSASPRNPNHEVVSSSGVPSDRMALDIGPKTCENLRKLIDQAGTILWLGGIGFHKVPAFSHGTASLMRHLADASGFTMVAGSDTVAAAREVSESLPDFQLSQLDCISTGGAATIALLSQSKLPGLEALRGKQ